MALIRINYFSRTLLRNTEVNVIIPTETSAEMNRDFNANFLDEYPVLYLYHGAFGDYTDWIRSTDIESYAQKYQIAVVMPSVENTFALNIENGDQYLTFAGEELPLFLEHILPVSKKREKTFAAGLSMGGYVAYSLAVHFPERFSHAASLSGALNLNRLVEMQKNGAAGLPFSFRQLLGNNDAKKQEELDLIALYKKCQEKGYNLKLYQACGTEDFLYELNQEMRHGFAQIEADHFYEEGTGAHEWTFWNKYIERAIGWMLR